MRNFLIILRKYFILILFSIIATFSFGQNHYQDVVYLKNGSIIRGIIIEQIPNESIKIETADRNVFFYKIEEIEKFTKESIQDLQKGSSNYIDSQQGYKGIFELGYQIGSGSLGMDRIKLNIINGYQFNSYFSLGIGTGLRYYMDADAVLIPLFADFRTNFIKNSVSPYAALDVGYSFDATNKFKGVGFLLSPTIGISLDISDNSQFNIGIGYEMQKMIFRSIQLNPYSMNLSYNDVQKNSGAINISIGITF